MTSTAVTRIGHSCHLIELGGKKFLTDPWFSERPGYHPGEPVALPVDELPALDGVVLFSLFVLPAQRDRRMRAYERVLAEGKTLHAALENLVLAERSDVAAWEDIIGVDAVLEAAPFGGRYEKTAAPLGPDADTMARALSASP